MGTVSIAGVFGCRSCLSGQVDFEGSTKDVYIYLLPPCACDRNGFDMV